MAVTLCSLIALSQQQCCEECLKPLRENEFYNIKTFADPFKSNFTGFCQDSFTREGTCCDQNDASQYTKNWLRNIKIKVNSTLGVLEKFDLGVEFVHELKKYTTSKKDAILKSKAITKEELEDF